MKKRMIIVDECFQCRWIIKFDDGELVCDRTEKEIPNAYSIPSWCPLPEAPNQPLQSDGAEKCSKCGSDLGHFVNCPDGIAFTKPRR